MPQVLPCSVCAGPGEGQFFGALSCRCCAAFFRRSVRHGRNYVCRANGNCPINEDGMRNCCRACRFQRCLHAGMEYCGTEANARLGPRKVRLHNNNPARKPTESPSSSSDSPTTNACLHSLMIGPPLSPPMAAPMSVQFATALCAYQERLRAICAQHLGLDVALGCANRLIELNECILLDKLSAPLYLELVRGQFREFDSGLVKSQKIKLMHDFILHFGFLYSWEITMQMFGKQQQLTQMALFPGCVVDSSNNFAHFINNLTGIAAEEQKNMHIQLLMRILKFISRRYKPMAIGPLEFAAMAAIVLWNCENRVSEDAFQSQRNALLDELHTLASQHCSANPTAGKPSVRFGNLMLLLWELTNIVDKDFSEVMTIGNMFSDKNSCVDYEEMWDKLL